MAGSTCAREDIFFVPFDSIGLKVVGKSYAKDRDFNTHTLVHELTHQMMHSWLPYLPQWVVEGTAEYTGMLPLSTGKFRVSSAKTGLKDYVNYLKESAGSVPDSVCVGRVVPDDQPKSGIRSWEQITREAGSLYFTSYLLVYYFMHLDGEGDGQLFVKYFRVMGEVRKEVEAYLKAVEEFKKQPGVEVLARMDRIGGRTRWFIRKAAVMANGGAGIVSEEVPADFAEWAHRGAVDEGNPLGLYEAGD